MRSPLRVHARSTPHAAAAQRPVRAEPAREAPSVGAADAAGTVVPFVPDRRCGTVVSWRFPASPVNAHMARVWLEALMAECGPGVEAASCAAVVFSELVTNAVVHGTGPVAVRARLKRDLIECEVTDEAADLPVVHKADGDDENHRGLCLVDSLATTWEVRRRAAGGKTVTFTVRG